MIYILAAIAVVVVIVLAMRKVADVMNRIHVSPFERQILAERQRVAAYRRWVAENSFPLGE